MRQALAKGDHEQLWSLQYLRAIAAILVVIGHAVQIVPLHGRGDGFREFPIGGAGVDIFFVISGFIMCHISATQPTSGWQFFKRRLARVGPAYWIVTLATSVAILLLPSLFRSSTVTLPLFLASMAFIAWPNPGLNAAMPVFLIGWTLNYEFYFYALFALAIALLPARPWLLVGLIFALSWALGAWVRPDNLIAQFYTHPITLEFVGGMALWKAYRAGWLQSAIWGFALVVMGTTLLGWVNWAVPIARMDAMRALYWGLPGLILVAGALCFDGAGRVWHSPIWKLLGDASYSIYLIHFLSLGIVRLVWGQFGLKHHFPDIVLVLCAVIASLFASLIFYWLVERPASAAVRRALR
ncbi:MAG: hypothetical protein RL317_1169 [Pseudomonadota bacterium]|jgi:exopolysaccharide production protein ExoZ